MKRSLWLCLVIVPISCLQASAQTEVQGAVRRGLDWLARHQSASGAWEAHAYIRNCRGTCPGVGKAQHDVGVTGLALFAFLGAGERPGKGARGHLLERAVAFLIGRQEPGGRFGSGGERHMYDHAIATLALAEASLVSPQAATRRAVKRAAAFLQRARRPDAGWRYQARPARPDSSVTGWALHALHVARAAGVRDAGSGINSALKWLDAMTDDSYCRTGYLVKGDRGSTQHGRAGYFRLTDTGTAVALGTRLMLGGKPKDDLNVCSAELLLQSLPAWRVGERSSVNFYHWYFGTFACRMMGARFASAWQPKVLAALLPQQKREACEEGSWEPSGPWGPDGGRVYSTAIAVLTLQLCTPSRNLFLHKGIRN